jgi:hypothetical protein
MSPRPSTYQKKLGVPIALIHIIFAEKSEAQFGSRVSELLGAWHVSVYQILVHVVKPTLTGKIKGWTSTKFSEKLK